MCHKYFEQVLNICVISSTLFDGRIVQSFDVSSNYTRESRVLAASRLLSRDSRYEELYLWVPLEAKYSRIGSRF